MTSEIASPEDETTGDSTSRRVLGDWEDRSYSTEVNLLLSAMGGVCLAILFYLAVIHGFRETRVGQIFLDRGWVTKMEAFLAAWATCFMLMKAWQLRRQRRLTCIKLIPPNLPLISKPTEIMLALDALNKHKERNLRNGILFRRVRQSLLHYRYHPSREAVSGMLESIAVVDASRTENTYSMLRVMIWAIPIVGFIGTVVGLGGAVGGFSESLPKATDFVQLKGLLGGVTSGLSVAFDATFVALLISIFLMFPASALEKSEQNLLSSIDEYCQDNLVGWFSESSTSRTGPVGDLKELSAALEQSLKLQQQKFLEWWAQVNQTVGTGLKSSMDAINLSAKSVSAAAERLHASVAAAANQANAIAAPLTKAAENASGIAECMSVARGEAQGIRDAVLSTTKSAGEIQAAYGQCSVHARECVEASKGVEQHLVAARTAAEQLESEVHAALTAAADRYADEVEARIGEIKTHAANMNQAAEGLRVFADRLALKRPGADGNGG